MNSEATLTDGANMDRLVEAARDRRPVTGLTHNFYRYPARFSPAFAAAAIECLSKPGDLVLDPYMGGGTTVVESIARGRPAVGNDLNSLACFVAAAKTTFISDSERIAIQHWADDTVPMLNYRVSSDELEPYLQSEKTYNLSLPRGRFIKKFLAAALSSIERQLPTEAGQSFVRCAVLRVGQWALDGRKTHTSLRHFRQRLTEIVHEMINGLDDLKSMVHAKNTSPMLVLNNGDAAHLPSLPVFAVEGRRANLVVTSPPYPGVHVLYHRWQVDGRRETPAPYWIAGCSDGQGASYYNFADRRQGADDRYFEVSLETLKAVREVMADGGLMVQMVAFGRPTAQLPKYLRNMAEAGFREIKLKRQRIWREVPNRRWHAACKGRTNGANEVVLIHQAD